MLNRKLTGALAWGGLALILAVPSADFLSAKVAGPKDAGTPAGDPVTTASISDGATTIKVPVVHAAPVPINGRPMPSYISDPDTHAATVPAPQVPKVTTQPKVQTATVAPDAVPPVPMPAHMRPLPPTVTSPATTAPVQPAPQVAVVAPPPVSAQGEPLILDEDEVLANEAALSDPQPVVPQQNPNVPRPPALVTEDQLDDWDSGSLADYLEQRGLLSDATYTETNVRPPAQVDDTYDADGFYLSDGPNDQRRVRRDGNGNLIIPAN